MTAFLHTRPVRAALALFAALLAAVLCACAPSAGPAEPYTALDAYPAADMSGYACAADYEQDYRFADMTVAEVAAEMDAGTTFALFVGFDECPWCNSILNLLNDVASERGITFAYIDTRRDPSWQSNTDLEDYDLFIERFGSVIEPDDSGEPHLFVPHTFFVKDGDLVADHAGTVATQEESSDALSSEEQEEFKDIIRGYLSQIGL